MSNTFNCVVWAAVSSKGQASPDKFSLTDQVQRGQAFITLRGWREAHAPLVVRGESRQEHITLDEARARIAELDTLLKLVQGRAVNLVICIDNDRFRGLLDQVVRTLARYGCQLYSLYQPVEPQAPDEYDLYNNDAQIINTGLSQMVSTMYIANFRRKYRSGMKARVDHFGLPPNHLRYGYRKPEGRELDRKAVPVIHAPEAAILKRIKRDYLRGTPAYIIAAQLNAEGVIGQRGGRWDSGNITKMICDPFYAGFVARGRHRLTRGEDGKKRVQYLPADQWTLAPGKHEALWSEDDWKALRDIRQRRGARFFGVSRRPRALSSLLVCAKCDRRLRFWIGGDTRIYKCPNGGLGQGHGYIHEDAALDQLRDELSEAIHALEIDPQDPDEDDKTTNELTRLSSALADNDSARARLQRLYLKNTITESDLEARLAELDAERAAHLEAQAKLGNAADRETRAANRRMTAGDVVARFEQWRGEDRATFNGILLIFLERVTVSARQITDIYFRDD